jgi:uncharacterized protein (DUF2384 family)
LPKEKIMNREIQREENLRLANVAEVVGAAVVVFGFVMGAGAIMAGAAGAMVGGVIVRAINSPRTAS